MSTRADGRGAAELRTPRIELGLQRNPEGSVVYRCGGTKVLLAASIQDGVRDFLRGTGRGWVTAEYAMHPRANPERQTRDGRRGSIDGRSQEIQRLIGRSLRSAVEPTRLGERTLTVDCDVLDADGGTRTAAVTGGWVALALALEHLRTRGLVEPGVLREPVAAVSTGLVDGVATLDLAYAEDAAAAVDLNVVGTAGDAVVEVQGTAEGAPVPRSRLDELVDLAMQGIPKLIDAQRAALDEAGVKLDRLMGT